MKNEKRIGLALSGGGYRAAAFHLGTLRKLHQLNILDKVDVLSTISGGSITGAAYLTKKWNYPAFEKQMIETLTTKSVVRYIISSFLFWRAVLPILVILIASIWILFTSYAWLSPILLFVLVLSIMLFQYRIFPVSRIIERAYDKYFFENKTLSQLIEFPDIAIGSTNIQTCRPFSFSRDRMGDSAYTYHKPPVTFDHTDFPVSRAVMASSCVPFAFAPVLIESKYYRDKSQASEFKPVLVDGGVYDNQGVHKLTETKSFYRCDVVIASDAGNKPQFMKSFNNVMVLLIRTMDVFMARIKDFQIVTNVYRNTSSGTNREITYVSLGWDLDKLIPGFVRNLADGNIAPSVLAKHNIPPNLLNNVTANAAQIQSFLENLLNFQAIKQGIVNDADLLCARGVGTNLTKLSVQEVDCLMRHASNITDLQVQLYCPSII